jgi:hypothetical protein
MVHIRFLAYAIEGNLLSESIEVNAEKAKCLFMSGEQNAEQTHNMGTGDKFFESVVKKSPCKPTLHS